MESGLPLKGMQTSPSPLLMSREQGTLGAQNIGEDTNLLMQGFKFSFTRLGGVFLCRRAPRMIGCGSFTLPFVQCPK